MYAISQALPMMSQTRSVDSRQPRLPPKFQFQAIIRHWEVTARVHTDFVTLYIN